MTLTSPGIHHVTAIAGDTGPNLAFYTDTLGLRLVKQTINFDDPTTYHLYYGDRVGTPGTAMTFFPIPVTGTGSIGTGQVVTTSLTVPPDSLDWWYRRLTDHDFDPSEPFTRFDERVLAVADPDGLDLELVERQPDDSIDPWTAGIDEAHAIAGFDGVTLDSRSPGETTTVLELLGFTHVDSAADRRRFEATGTHGRFIDLVDEHDHTGRSGPGTVHHVAIRATDEEEQLEWREWLLDAGYHVTPVRDRHYFKSIYFREPGGILFEIATDGPGFDLDESVDTLGESLQVPPWLDHQRSEILRQLPPLEFPTEVS